MNKFKVNVIEDLTGSVVKEFFCANERQAEKTLDGVLRNLNHERFSACIEEIETPELHQEAK